MGHLDQILVRKSERITARVSVPLVWKLKLEDLARETTNPQVKVHRYPGA